MALPRSLVVGGAISYDARILHIFSSSKISSSSFVGSLPLRRLA